MAFHVWAAKMLSHINSPHTFFEFGVVHVLIKTNKSRAFSFTKFSLSLKSLNDGKFRLNVMNVLHAYSWAQTKGLK